MKVSTSNSTLVLTTLAKDSRERSELSERSEPSLKKEKGVKGRAGSEGWVRVTNQKAKAITNKKKDLTQGLKAEAIKRKSQTVGQGEKRSTQAVYYLCAL